MGKVPCGRLASDCPLAQWCQAINAEPDVAKSLPLNSGGGVALVDCRDGACVVACDGIACIKTVLRMWDRRRCINSKCMRQAKKWFVSQHADQLMPLATYRLREAERQQREAENSWRDIRGSGWGKVAETHMEDPRWLDFIAAVRSGDSPGLTWVRYLAELEHRGARRRSWKRRLRRWSQLPDRPAPESCVLESYMPESYLPEG